MVPCTQISLQPLEVSRLPPLAKHKVEECGDTMRSKYWHILLSMYDTYLLCDIGIITLLVVSLLLCLLAFEFRISDDGLKFKADVLNSFVDYVINLGSSCLVAKAFILLYSDS
jgi:hypothetical protein